MTRNRAFDENNVLDAAANVFRKRGYLSASIKELEQATGLTSGSIYNAYRDKAGLFAAAIDRYVHAFVAARVAAYAGEQSTIDDLERLVMSVLEAPLADGYGCLVVNSMAEFGSGASIATKATHASMAMLERAVGAVLRRELGADLAPIETARLLVLYHGVLLLSRGDALPDATVAMLRAEFERLRTLKRNVPRIRVP